MKFLVIGAAGRTGHAVVEKAVAAGHVVTAFVRKTEEYKGTHVRVVAGDATDRANVDVAMADQDAVIDTIGGKAPYRKTSLERSVAGTTHIQVHSLITRALLHQVRRIMPER